MWGEERGWGKWEKEAKRPVTKNLKWDLCRTLEGGCNLQCYRNCRIVESLGAAGAANVRAMQR